MGSLIRIMRLGLVKIVWTKDPSTLNKGIERYNKKVGFNGIGGADFKARKDVGLALLNLSVNSPPAPPIDMGILRGSGSVFTGNTLIGDTKGLYSNGKPNREYQGKPNEITIGYNTAYAARMHETNWKPGTQSKAAGNVGNKWLKKHLEKDGKNLLALYAKKLKEFSGA